MNLKMIGIYAGLVLLGTLVGVAVAGYRDANASTPTT